MAGAADLTAHQRKRQRRRQRQEQRGLVPARHQRRAQWWRWLAAAAIVLALAGGGFMVFGELAKEPPGTAVPDMGNQHVQPGEAHQPYNSDPPTSGPHFATLIPWGIYDRPIPPEQQLHQMEDGGVLIQYNCSDCPELVAQLAALVRSYQGRGLRRLILAPYPIMSARLALTAWTRIDLLDDFDAERVRRFIEAYHGIDHHRG